MRQQARGRNNGWKNGWKNGGFVLPVVLFGLMLMSTVAVAVLFMSADEHRASQAMRLSAGAFYTAEAGMNQVFATWEDYSDDIDALAPGDSADLGWQTLATGSSYRAVVHRWDSGEQPMYRLTVSGHTKGASAGSRTLSMSLTAGPGGPGAGYMIGECCDAAAKVRGSATVEESSVLDGHDQHPPGWEDAGVCADTTYDRPGLVMQDTSLLTNDEDGVITGEPPVVEDPTISDDDFFQFGPDLTWDDIKDLADYTVGTPGDEVTLNAGDVYPRYNADGSCDTSHPYNWGSTDPEDPCFNYFPIILVQGDVALETGLYGQGILILDYWTEGDQHVGSELDLEDYAEYNGIILGKGCVEIQRESILRGAVYADGDYQNPLCGTDDSFDMNKEGYLDWSQCAVDRALTNSGLSDYAEPTIGGGPGGISRLPSRSYLEIY